MKVIACLGFLISASVFAEDGLVVHFKIIKMVGNETDTYTDGVLMRLTETTTQTFPKLYELNLNSKAIENEQVNLVVTLKDLSSGKPVYAGSNAVTLKVGASKTVSLHTLPQAQTRYDIVLDTSYGKLPEVTN